MKSDIAILLPNFLRPDALAKNFSILSSLSIPILVSVDKFDGTDPKKSALNQQCFEIAHSLNAVTVRNSGSSLGCRLGIETALDWATDLYDSIIVIEDDLDFDVSAIEYFEQLLQFYPEDEEIFISGNNFSNCDDFHWTSCMHIWGWACTSASWKKYRTIFEELTCDVRDLVSLNFDYKRKFPNREELFNYISVIENLGCLAKKARNGEIDTWDYQLAYYIFLQQIRVIAPPTDLFSNNGFDSVATHTTSGSSPKPIYSRFDGFPEALSLNCQTWDDSSLGSLLGSSNCPICDANSEIFGAFEGGLRFPLIYRRCAACQHLFVRRCGWIDAAYAPGVDIFDQGAVNRSLFTLPLAFALSQKVDGLILDYGGGSGLLARMLRDFGINAYSFDRYSVGSLNPGFAISDPHTIDSEVGMLIAVEVLEHLTDPSEFIALVNQLGPEIILTSTTIRQHESIEWNYIDKNHCQHISIFTRRSLEIFASKIGMKVHFAGVYQIFYRDIDQLAELKIPSLSDLMNDYERLNYHHAASDQQIIVGNQPKPVYL
jgi:hypothetical protein